MLKINVARISCLGSVAAQSPATVRRGQRREMQCVLSSPERRQRCDRLGVDSADRPLFGSTRSINAWLLTRSKTTEASVPRSGCPPKTFSSRLVARLSVGLTGHHELILSLSQSFHSSRVDDTRSLFPFWFGPRFSRAVLLSAGLAKDDGYPGHVAGFLLSQSMGTERGDNHGKRRTSIALRSSKR